MSDSFYRKRGHVVRYEFARRRSALLTVRESGIAEARNGVFTARAAKCSDLALPESSSDALHTLVRSVHARMPAPLRIERLVATQGIACHRFEREGVSREWRDEAARLHVSIVSENLPLRVSLDLGSTTADAIELADLDDAASALVMAQPLASEQQADIVFAPYVAASLLPLLARAPALRNESRNELRVEQRARAEMPFDGEGVAINAAVLTDGAWPNVFRPSYRHRPIRTPFHLAMREFGVMRDAAFRVVALSASPRLHGTTVSLLAILLATAQNAAVHAACSFELTSITAAASAPRWYPIEGGALGPALFVRGASLTPP